MKQQRGSEERDPPPRCVFLEWALQSLTEQKGFKHTANSPPDISIANWIPQLYEQQKNLCNSSMGLLVGQPGSRGWTHTEGHLMALVRIYRPYYTYNRIH